MKKITLFSLLILFAYVSSAQVDATTLVKTGAKAPLFKFESDKGKFASIEDYKGKLVLINFFATWCGPCRQELPRVQKEVWEKYKDNPKFSLLVFGREEGWEKVLPFKDANKYTFPMLPDERRKIFSLYATQSIPRNVVLDENGTVIYQSIGYSTEEFGKLLALIDKKLK